MAEVSRPPPPKRPTIIRQNPTDKVEEDNFSPKRPPPKPPNRPPSFRRKDEDKEEEKVVMRNPGNRPSRPSSVGSTSKPDASNKRKLEITIVSARPMSEVGFRDTPIISGPPLGKPDRKSEHHAMKMSPPKCLVPDRDSLPPRPSKQASMNRPPPPIPGRKDFPSPSETPAVSVSPTPRPRQHKPPPESPPPPIPSSVPRPESSPRLKPWNTKSMTLPHRPLPDTPPNDDVSQSIVKESPAKPQRNFTWMKPDSEKAPLNSKPESEKVPLNSNENEHSQLDVSSIVDKPKRPTIIRPSKYNKSIQTTTSENSSQNQNDDDVSKSYDDFSSSGTNQTLSASFPSQTLPGSHGSPDQTKEDFESIETDEAKDIQGKKKPPVAVKPKPTILPKPRLKPDQSSPDSESSPEEKTVDQKESEMKKVRKPTIIRPTSMKLVSAHSEKSTSESENKFDDVPEYASIQKSANTREEAEPAITSTVPSNKPPPPVPAKRFSPPTKKARDDLEIHTKTDSAPMRPKPAARARPVSMMVKSTTNMDNPKPAVSRPPPPKVPVKNSSRQEDVTSPQELLRQPLQSSELSGHSSSLDLEKQKSNSSSSSVLNKSSPVKPSKPPLPVHTKPSEASSHSPSVELETLEPSKLTQSSPTKLSKPPVPVHTKPSSEASSHSPSVDSETPEPSKLTQSSPTKPSKPPVPAPVRPQSIARPDKPPTSLHKAKTLTKEGPDNQHSSEHTENQEAETKGLPCRPKSGPVRPHQGPEKAKLGMPLSSKVDKQDEKGPALPSRPSPGHPLYHYMLSVPHGLALHDYDGAGSDDLSFKANDMIILTKRIDDSWLYGQMGESMGMFPSNFIQILRPFDSEALSADHNNSSPVTMRKDSESSPVLSHGSPVLSHGSPASMRKDSESSPVLSHGSPVLSHGSPVTMRKDSHEFSDFNDSPVASVTEKSDWVGCGPRCVARFDFDGEGSGDLCFEEGDYIRLVEKVDDEWVRGEIHGRVGILPMTFVEVIEDLPHLASEEMNVHEKNVQHDELGHAEPEIGMVSEVPSKELETEHSNHCSLCQAIADFHGDSPGDLGFTEGEFIEILEQIDENWLRGRLKNQEGIFPASFVKMVDNSSQCLEDTESIAGEHTEEVIGKALYDFNGETDNELTFKVGDTVKLGAKIDGDWRWGQINGHTGIFPASFVKEVT